MGFKVQKLWYGRKEEIETEELMGHVRLPSKLSHGIRQAEDAGTNHRGDIVEG